jgi:uncharacterized protein (DUF736 family)
MQQRPNTGVLFKNNKKTSDKAPDYTGNIDVDGGYYKLAAWVKPMKTGGKFLSISVSNNYEYNKNAGTETETEDDGLPF